MEILDILDDLVDKTTLPHTIVMDEYVTGPEGMKFILFPEEFIHNEKDIDLFRKYLYRNRDVVSIRITKLTKAFFDKLSHANKTVIHKHSLGHILELNKSGYAGILPEGTIVDRRRYPNATPIQKNGMFGIPEPKPL